MYTRKTLSIFTLLTITPMMIDSVSFSSNDVFAADSFTDNVSLTIPVSCSLGGTVNTEHTATLQNGTYSASTGSDYENGIGKTTLTVFCNDNNGFSVYAIGYTGDTDSGDNINKLVGQNTGSTINTKVYSSGDTTSNWSMKVNKVADDTISYVPNNMTITNSYDNWHIVPNTYDQVLTYKAETGSSATDATLGAKLETTYAAYISSTQPADTYQGKVKYVLVNPYNAEAPRPLLYMQDVNKWGNTIAAGEEVTAIDSRDGKSYTVARLADGNLWMTQNLDHDIVTDGSVIYDNTTTDLGWDDLTSSYATANWLPSTATHETSVTTWNWTNTAPESYDPGGLYWTGATKPNDQVSCEAASGVWNGSYCTNYDLIFISSTGDSHYHLGNYYNLTAAVAMDDTSSYETDGYVFNQSICPTGWTLPKAGSITTNGSFQYLIEQYGWNSDSQVMDNPTIWDSSIKTPLSGVWEGSLNNVGVTGVFFSPMARGSGGTYTDGLTISYGGGVLSDYQVLRVRGNSVRCISRY